MAIIAERLWA